MSEHEKQWIGLHVLTGAEADVLYALGTLPDVRALCPMERMTRRKGGRVRETKRPLLPGYVLLNWTPDADRWHYIRKTGGVIRILGGWPPSAIPQEQMESWLALDEHCKAGQPARIVCEAGRMKIKDGLLEGLEIAGVNRRAMRAQIEIGLLNETHRVTVGIEEGSHARPQGERGSDRVKG